MTAKVVKEWRGEVYRGGAKLVGSRSSEGNVFPIPKKEGGGKEVTNYRTDTVGEDRYYNLRPVLKEEKGKRSGVTPFDHYRTV